MISRSAAQVVNQPEEEGQDNRDNYAACDGDEDAPVFRAGL